MKRRAVPRTIATLCFNLPPKLRESFLRDVRGGMVLPEVIEVYDAQLGRVGAVRIGRVEVKEFWSRDLNPQLPGWLGPALLSKPQETDEGADDA